MLAIMLVAALASPEITMANPWLEPPQSTPALIWQPRDPWKAASLAGFTPLAGYGLGLAASQVMAAEGAPPAIAPATGLVLAAAPYGALAGYAYAGDPARGLNMGLATSLASLVGAAAGLVVGPLVYPAIPPSVRSDGSVDFGRSSGSASLMGAVEGYFAVALGMTAFAAVDAYFTAERTNRLHGEP